MGRTVSDETQETKTGRKGESPTRYGFIKLTYIYKLYLFYLQFRKTVKEGHVLSNVTRRGLTLLDMSKHAEMLFRREEEGSALLSTASI
jgi:hypothetical protein